MQDAFFGWVTDMVRAHRARLAHVAREQGLAWEDALDVVQESFVSFLVLPQARTLVHEPEDTAKVLSVLAKNAARNARRRHHRARPHTTDDAEIEGLTQAAAGIDELMAQAEMHARALGCIQKLADMQRRVVTLRLLEDLPGERVAEMLGTTSGHVAVVLHRAKADLRSCVEEAREALVEA